MLNKTLKSILADTPFVKNLDHPGYLETILDGCRTLEERFAKIDSRLVAEQLKAKAWVEYKEIKEKVSLEGVIPTSGPKKAGLPIPENPYRHLNCSVK